MVARANPVLNEIDYWSRLGVPVLPGVAGEKGAWPKGWPTIPAEETWKRARAVAMRPMNLAVRLGATADGTRFLAHIDLDGKCPCGGDLSDHQTHGGRLGACRGERCMRRGCACELYAGVAPKQALARLLELLPDTPLLIKTRRGYHAYFWSPREYAASVLPQLGADVAATSRALSVIPPSTHPSGTRYEYLHRPVHDLPLVDLRAIGLEPVSKGHRTGAAAHRPPVTAAQLPPAPSNVQSEFLELFRQAGLYISSRPGDQVHVCPWHADTEASLSIHAEAALFHCFGCGAGGGIARLRALVGLVPPTCDPLLSYPIASEEGFQLGGDRAVAERDRLAGAFKELGENERADRTAGCREQSWDSPDSLEVLACPRGDAAPVRRRTNSCDDPLCAVCMPWRLAADWRARWGRREQEPPEHLTLVVLDAVATSRGLDDRAYLRQIRSQFKEWRRARGIDAGFYGLVFERHGLAWRARLLLAIPDEQAPNVADGRAFSARVWRRNASSQELVRSWQQAYLEEASGWTTLEELEALRLMTRGRRKFQGWGDHFDNKEGQVAEQEADSEMTKKAPLHNIAGGSGGSTKGPHACPRCGENLRVVGLFDPDRMEVFQGHDGVREWRWKSRGT